MDLLATFPSTHAVLAAEARLRAAGLEVELIPVPRQIRSSCGFCLLAQASAEAPLLAQGPERLWRVLEPGPGHPRRRYEPCP
ncbi:DUF3343 domain-containing protein [Mesoterricola sediminis]|uniref:Putative Se/S carrier protein-like domain-containing protein n=1 Tax=Mesoterricola sediminis TaxID=2927980 RepID=A0AA48HIE2_9BACT|nr:DUF3343 domain-containing protein [Mesoterricola sediminis]BDU78768.1 hypothetical protein METESE_37260 [Mesoterricola sediminis]